MVEQAPKLNYSDYSDYSMEVSTIRIPVPPRCCMTYIPTEMSVSYVPGSMTHTHT